MTSVEAQALVGREIPRQVHDQRDPEHFVKGRETVAPPEAFAERTGKADIRGAYGLHGREMLAWLTHLQHTRGRNVIFVGILEKVTDEFNRTTWQPQMEGGKAGRELPGIVDQVISMSLFAPDGDGWRHDPEHANVRRLVCRAGNPFGLPAKDRSGRLDMTEPPYLGALLAKINSTTKG